MPPSTIPEEEHECSSPNKTHDDQDESSSYPEADEHDFGGSALSQKAPHQQSLSPPQMPAGENPFLAKPDETAWLFDSIHNDLDQAEAEARRAELAAAQTADSDSDNSDNDEEDRSEVEIEAIAWELRQLEHKFKDMADAYTMVDRLGEGTFSSVYKAIDERHHQYDNKLWCKTCRGADTQALPTPDPSSSNGREVFSAKLSNKRKRGAGDDGGSCSYHSDSPAASATAPPTKHKPGKDVYVAIKRIYVTSSPQRILNELEILHALRGCTTIAHLITAFRHEDQVLAVMPFERHQDFRTYYRTMSLPMLQSYLRCLFSALEYSHAQGILHRDVKPANFLFNTRTHHGTLCDFGLAENFQPSEWASRCLHSLPAPTMGAPHGRLLSSPQGLWRQVEARHADWKRTPASERKAKGWTMPWVPVSKEEEWEMKEQDELNHDFYNSWEPVMSSSNAGSGAGASGNSSSKKASRVGYLKPEYEKRGQIRANRAGTRGFRAPEVLLKCPDQTVAIDIWSVGIIILCILTRRFPFFHSNDDVEALMEIGTIFGKKKMDICAQLHNRTFKTNVPSVVDPEFSTLHQLVYSLNPAIFSENRPASAAWNQASGSSGGEEEDDLTWYAADQPLFQAIDLMRKCMSLDCTRRITAKDALQHAFLKEQ